MGQGTPPGGFPTIWVLTGPNGEIVQTTLVCPSTASPATPPPAPPNPPTPAEATAATPFPAPTFNWNPNGLGLTGLASWFWATNVPPTLSATASIRGYTVVTTAQPVKYYWYFGDGGGETSTSPGSLASPSATHVYEVKGLYTLTLTIAWQGQYTFTGKGVAPQTVQLGTVDQTPATSPYRVQEIRSVLIAPPG